MASIASGDLISLSLSDGACLAADAITAALQLNSGQSTSASSSDALCFEVQAISAQVCMVIQPRELVTLQHVDSGLFLVDDGSSVRLLPKAGPGSAWELIRALAALGVATLAPAL